MNVGSGGIDAVNKAQRVVDTTVHLHDEVPFVAFSGLVHLWVALARVVLRGAGSRGYGGINNAAFAQHQAVFLKVLVHFFEQHFAKAVALQEMAELEDRGFVRQPVQLQAGELAHRFDLLQSVFHGRIAKVIEQLHAVNSQHSRQRISRPSILALGVIRGYLLFQLLPRNQLVYQFQKDLATRLALLGLVLGFGEGDLIHGDTESYAVYDGRIIADFQTYSEPP